MTFVSNALGCQPAPTIPERRCVSCGVLACQPDGTPWRNSIRLIAGERVTICERCGDEGDTMNTPTRPTPSLLLTLAAIALYCCLRALGGLWRRLQ